MNKSRKKYSKIILIFNLIIILLVSCVYTHEVKAVGSQLKISTDDVNWGIAATGLDKYVQKLTEDGNDIEVKVAILDTGINLNHEIFDGRLDLNPLYARDFANNDDTMEDLAGTGTAMASIIAECTPSNVKIIPVKVVDYESQVFFKLDELYNGLKAVANYADIICFGIGIDHSIPTEEQVSGLASTLSSELYNANTVLLSCAGDMSTASNKKEVQFPAFLDNFVNATSVDSSLNVTSTACVGDEIDYALPGENIRVASNRNNTGYVQVSGTRYALCFMGAAYANAKAELKAKNSSASKEEILEVLTANCVDLGQEGKDNTYGYGFIDFNSNMFRSSAVEVGVVNTTSSKATVTFNSENSSTSNFTAEIESGTLSVSCENPCFVLTTSDGGETYTKLEGTVSDTDLNTYNYEFELVEGTEILVTIKGDADCNGIVNGNDVVEIKNMIKRGDAENLSALNTILYNLDGNIILNANDVVALKNSIKGTEPFTW